jgi:hypothetical protein
MGKKGKAKPSLKKTADGCWRLRLPITMRLVLTGFHNGVFIFDYKEADSDG